MNCRYLIRMVTHPLRRICARVEDEDLGVPDLGKEVPEWFSDLKKPYGSTSQYHLEHLEAKPVKDLTDAPNWFVREVKDKELSSQYHLDTNPVPEEVVEKAVEKDDFLTCESDYPASCTCGIVKARQ